MSKPYSVVGVLLALVLAVGTPAFAQGTQTGELTGNVSDSQGLPLPGTVVVVTSPALQGTRETTTDNLGIYLFRGLPPGRYTVRFDFTGTNPVEDVVQVLLGETAELNVTLAPAGVQEEVTVTAETPTVLTTPQVSTSIQTAETNLLPIGRTLFQIAELSGNVTSNTPNAGQLSIGGAFAYDNVFLVDGVDVNDNLFGTANNLFIEDAIEEVQVLTGAIPAEYGRFSGGVVNAITKSGSNDLFGSFRVNLNKPSWSEETPFEETSGIERSEKLSKFFEGTLGGPIMRDHVWFFWANRNVRDKTDDTLRDTGLPFTTEENEDRYEIKITTTPWANQTLQGVYIKNNREQISRRSLSFTIDPAGLMSTTLPNDLFSLNWNGVLGDNWYATAQYSQKQFGFRDFGGTITDIRESPFVTINLALGHYNAPYFDATDPEDRNNNQFAGSLSYFLSTTEFGRHDFKFGFEHLTTTRTGGNSQSATNYVFDADYLVDDSGAPIFDEQGRLQPVFEPGVTYYENWLPVRGAELDVRTLSLYVQDNWTINNNWSANLGVRFEDVQTESTGNVVGIDTRDIVPRLGTTYDVLGDGRYVFQGGYAIYSGKYSESQIGNNTNVGNPDGFFGLYVGPPGVGRDFAPGFDVENNYLIFLGVVPTANVFFDEGLSSPKTQEITLSFGSSIGPRGHAKATYLWRRMDNFIEDFQNIGNGVTTVIRDGVDFGTFTNIVYQNTDVPDRDYQALFLQSRYRLADNWTIDGSWTVQLQNEANFEGEAANQPGIGSNFGDYPEIFTAERHFPYGTTDDFQRHKVRLWSLYSLGMGPAGVLDIGALFRYNSALAYSLVALDQSLTATQLAILEAAGYPDQPSAASHDVFFGERGSQRFEGYGLFDLSFTYAVPFWQNNLRPWVKFDIFNVFNNDKLVQWNTTISQDPNSPTDELGLRTGYREGPRFGQGTATTHYPRWAPDQTGLRTFRVAFGFRVG